MIYEHRTYTTKPFRLRQQLDLFAEYGLPVIARHYGYPVLIGVQEDANVNSYIHIYEHESFEERFAKQARMRQDTEMHAYLDKVRAAETVVDQRCVFLLPPPFFKPPAVERTVMTLSPDLQALKDEVVRLRGYWHRFHDGLLAWSPGFLRAYLSFQSAPWRSGALEPKMREFIYIAVDGAVTHLYASGLRRHMDDALRLGATREEVLQVVLLTASAAAHATHELGFAILAEEMPEAVAGEPNAAQANARDAYRDATGSWPAIGDAVMAIAPEFAEGFFGYRQAAWQAGPLSDRSKALILLAYHASPTLLNRDGVRRYMREAICFGASAAEISEVLQLASAIAVHTCTYGVPALMDAVAEHETKATR